MSRARTGGPTKVWLSPTASSVTAAKLDPLSAVRNSGAAARADDGPDTTTIASAAAKAAAYKIALTKGDLEILHEESEGHHISLYPNFTRV